MECRKERRKVCTQYRPDPRNAKNCLAYETDVEITQGYNGIRVRYHCKHEPALTGPGRWKQLQMPI